jgi:hypothetical protein
VLRKRVNGALLLAAGSRVMSLMAESSSDYEEGDRCTLQTARGGGGGARGVERTGILEHGGEEGAESRQPAPLHEYAASERIAKWGSGGGSKEKKLKKKKWGRKRWSGFGQGILDRTGARQLLGRVRTPLWLVG